VEVLHVAGEFLPKISVNYVYGLCDVLLLMHFFHGFFLYMLYFNTCCYYA
jgi:hypothetical protein